MSLSSRPRLQCTASSELLLSGFGDLRVVKMLDRSSGRACKLEVVECLSETVPIRCFDSTTASGVLTVAIGHATGKLTLARRTLDQRVENGVGGLAVVNEFIPRHARSCNVIGICPSRPNLVLAGLDKVRNDHCLLVWDVEAQQRLGSGSLSSNNLATQASPLVQLGASEVVTSAFWANSNSPRMVAAMGLKWIRTYDVRQEATPVTVIATKSVFGLIPDPFHDCVFASYAESVVSVWDVRKTADPVLTFDTMFRAGINQLSFSGINSGVLAVIGRDGPYSTVWELKTAAAQLAPSNDLPDENTASPIDGIDVKSVPVIWNSRNVQPDTQLSPILCMTWMEPTAGFNAIITCHGRDVIHITELKDHKALSWHPQGPMLVVRDGILELPDITDNEPLFEIKRRAVAGYSLSVIALHFRLLDSNTPKAPENVEIVLPVPELFRFWSWFADLCRVSAENKCVLNGVDLSLLGISSIVELMKQSGISSTATPHRVSGHLAFVSYHHPLRTAGRLIAGAMFEDAVIFEREIKRLQASSLYAEAAFLTFSVTSDLKRAIACLNDSLDESHRLAAASLAGTSTEFSMWMELCADLSKSLRDRYLRTLFSVLAHKGDWLHVLSSSDLSLRERVALALLYLSDDEIIDFILLLAKTAAANGNIEGLLLTGFGAAGIDLLTVYVDRTGDFQTPCLLPLTESSIAGEQRLSSWVQSYRDVLDRWELFQERAAFDISKTIANQARSNGAPVKLYVRCNFCNQPIAHSLQKRGGKQGAANFCTSCRKPLPRCALCLMHMHVRLESAFDAPSSDFDSWFTWCQACRHGGHARHLQEWFSKNTCCPVSGCNCQCEIS